MQTLIKYFLILKRKMVDDNLDKDYNKLAEIYGLPGLDELDNIFILKEHLKKEDYSKNNLLRSINSRIIDVFNEWNNYLHTLIMPDPSNMINMTESQIFSEEEKNKIISIMNLILAFTSEHIALSIDRTEEKEARFLNKSIPLWNNVKHPLKQIIEKIRSYWENESKSKSFSD